MGKGDDHNSSCFKIIRKDDRGCLKAAADLVCVFNKECSYRFCFEANNPWVFMIFDIV